MASFVSTFTDVGLVNTANNTGTITLPPTTQIPFRQLIFKDSYGNTSNRPLRLSTQLGDTFEDGTTVRLLKDSFGFQTLYAYNNIWYFLGGTSQNAVTFSTLTVSSINSAAPGTLNSIPPFLSSFTVSTGSLNASSITALTLNVSTTGTISSLIVNSLQFGDGNGWVNIGPLQTVAISSIQANTNSLYTNNTYLGIQSSITALQFFGLQGNFNNTVIAEVSTGAGVEELLLFKGSSTSDRVRVQTTGTFVVETGVSSRLWDSNGIATQSNATPALIVNTSSNVGIQTATPATTLDVNGTTRTITLSTQQILTSSINGSAVLLTPQLFSTVSGLGTAGYISSQQLFSTVAGLGTTGYISSQQLISTTRGLETYISSFIDPTELTSSITSTVIGIGLAPNLTSTTIGLGSIGYISSQQLLSTAAGLIDVPELLSSLTGLGSLGYISSQQLISTTRGLETYISSFIDPTELTSSITSTVIGIGLGSNLTSTTIGLGTLGYISSQQLLSTTRGLETYISSFIDPTELTSSITSTVFGIGLGPNLTSTTMGLGTLGYISSQQLLSTTRGLETYISSFIDPTELTSSITSTVIGIGLAPNLTSTTIGLGTLGYISSQQLLSTAAGLIDVPELLSSLTGLGSLGYVSTLSLVSTTTGILRSGFISSPNLLGLVSTTFLDTSLQSTTTGISRSGFISSPNLLNLVSTQNLLGLVSTPNLLNLVSTSFVDTTLQSTVRGLATSGYISTSQLTSTVAGLATTSASPPFLSSFTVSTGSLNASSITGITANISSTATISSLIVNSLQFGDGTGWVNIGPIEAVAVSTAQLNTNTLYANNSLFGTASTVTALQFYGLQGNFNNTVLAEVSTGSGTQEFLVFRGSSASDRIRMQTTGSIVFEPGVSSRLWNSNTTQTLSNATPAMIINSSSNVGIQTLNPGATLDVNGSIRGVSLSSQQLFVSSVNGGQLLSVVNVQSTVSGLGSLGYISSLQLFSTVAGLGSAGYISSQQLISTTRGLETYISSFIDPTELASSITSTVFGLGLDSRFASTVTGLGSSGYVSTLSLISTTAGLVDVPELQSSLIGLGSLGFLSTSQLTSTVGGLGSASYISSLQLISTTFGLTSNISTTFSTLASGIPGAYGATLLYMNYSVAVGSNKELGLKPTTTGLVTLNTTINATSSSNIANFQTTAALPSFIPAGFWEINLFADASIASGISAYFELYQRSSGGVETLIVSGSANPEPILNVGVEQYVASLLVPYTVLASGSSVVLKVFGSNSTGSSATFTTYYENGYYSHVHTTFGTIIPGDELNSTIIGLGTLGYISTSQLLSTSLGLQTQFQTAGFLSSQNLLGLVSTPNLLNLVSTLFLDTTLQSTTTGISRSGYISTPNLADLVSTPFLNTSLASTVAGLGTGGLASIPANLSTFAIFTSSLMTSTMQSILISTGQLSVSSIGSVTTSTLQVFGSELIRFNGTSAVTLFGLSTDTLTLQTSSISYTGGIASLAFTTATSGYPLARIYGVDTATSGSAISQLVFQTAAASSANFNTTFNYTGSDQTFTVPAGVTSIQVTMWGAGGGGSTGATATGGAGAYIKGTLTVTPGQVYTVIVGQGGLRANAGGSLAIYGGGGPTSASNPVVNDSAGGGRSALQLNLTVSITTASGSGTTVTYTTNANHNLATNNIVVITGLSPAGYNGTFLVTGTPNATQFTVANTTTGTSSGTGAIKLEIVNVGGGGGGGNGSGANTPFGGNATFSGTAVSGGNSSSGGAAGIGGGGGSQTAGGSSPGTNAVGSNGTLLQGGRGAYRCGGGGGGFWGGGGGSTNSNADLGGGGGGGGSSYTAFSNFTLLVGSNSPNGISAPATTDPAYVTGVAAGGSNTSFGGSGLINLATVGNSLSEAMRIGSNGFLGIGTTTPATRLDVVGTGRFDTVSTSALTVRSNAAFFGNASTVTDIQFFGLQGNYNNTVVAEVSTGAGTQEFLIFKGSSASDRIRMQTTGAFVVETGVSSRLWSDTTIPTQSNATPAFVINTSSNVGIQTANPGATLDVNGTARAITLSSQQLFVSSVNGGLLLSVANVQSTLTGLGSLGYVSTSQLVSTTIAFQTAGFLSSQNLLNLVSTTFLDTTLQSTTTGISRSGFISTQNLLGLVSTPNLLNLVSTTFLDTSLQSTTTGISRSGYISTPNLADLVSSPNLLNLVSTSFLNTTLASTVSGLGTGGLATIPANLSTFAIFTSSILASTIQTTILSTQQIFTSSITGNQSFFQALSSQSLYVSSFYTATRQMTPMFVTF